MNRPRRRNLAAMFTVILPTACISAGCAMCCGPYDYHYPGFGGRIQRADPEYGRVGSVFSDPHMAGMGPLADSNIVEPEPYKLPDRERSTGDLPPPSDQPPSTPDGSERQTQNEWKPSPTGSPIGYR